MRNRTADLLLTMETLYRLSYWGLLPCGNEVKHTPNFGVLITKGSSFFRGGTRAPERTLVTTRPAAPGRGGAGRAADTDGDPRPRHDP